MIALVSGGFDPLHVGHVRYLAAAAKYGTLIVALNSDAWLRRKKGFVFMPWADRFEIMASLSMVASVVPVDDRDGTVCEAIERVRPDVFCNGGDRTVGDPRERTSCFTVGARELFGVGGGKIQSSSHLVAAARSASRQADHHEFDGDPR